MEKDGAGTFLDSDKMELLKKIGYTGDISHIEAKMQHDYIELQTAQKEAEKMGKSDGKGGMTGRDFTAWIVYVSKFMGFNIDRRRVFVAEFLEMNSQFEAEKKLKMKQEKRK
jgi:hypothetical protein